MVIDGEVAACVASTFPKTHVRPKKDSKYSFKFNLRDILKFV